MKILVLKEVTDWGFPNHTYHVIVGKSKLFGYERASDGKFIQFKKPLSFSRSRRKFKKVKEYYVEA